MNNELKQIAINNIIDAMESESLIIFVGAGVSANSGLPTWNDLIGIFRNELSLKIEDERDNLKVAQFYYDTWGKQKYYQRLIDVFGQHSSALPNDIHDQILKIQPKHIITTNYDTLLEEKMNTGINKYSVINKEEDIPYNNANNYIIKMHGDLVSKNIILKENDYLDYKKNFNMTSSLIKSLIMNHTILFLGYSLNDTTFNSIFRLIHNHFGENTKKAYFYTPSKPKTPIIEYYKNKGISVLYSEEKEVSESELGLKTTNFIASISQAKDPNVSEDKGLWREISFLDKFSFIEAKDVVKNIKLDKKASLFYPDNFRWHDHEQENFEFLDDSKTKKFLYFDLSN